MRKMFVVASREYLAAVRTKAFIIGLVILPLMMGGSVLIQLLVKNVRDTEDKHFAVIDRTPEGTLLPVIEKAVEEYNKTVFDPDSGKQVKPRLVVEPVKPGTNTSESIATQHLELSDRVRDGELFGFLDIGPEVMKKPEAGQPGETSSVRYYTNRATFMEFRRLAEQAITQKVLDLRATAFINEIAKDRPPKTVQKGVCSNIAGD